MQKEKRRLFISYYREDDQRYMDYIEEHLGSKAVIGSVGDWNTDTDDCDEYMNRLITEGKISDGMVMIVLVGPDTYRSKYIDWEMSAALGKKLEDNAALIGVILPNFPHYPGQDFIPERLVDNLQSGYADLYDWDTFIEDFENIVDKAYEERNDKRIEMNNARREMKKDLTLI